MRTLVTVRYCNGYVSTALYVVTNISITAIKYGVDYRTSGTVTISLAQATPEKTRRHRYCGISTSIDLYWSPLVVYKYILFGIIIPASFRCYVIKSSYHFSPFDRYSPRRILISKPKRMDQNESSQRFTCSKSNTISLITIASRFLRISTIQLLNIVL